MEWFNELIGFFIILLVLFIPLIRKIFIDLKKVQEKERQRLQSPPPPVKKVREPKPQAKAEPYLTTRTVKPGFAFHSDIEEATDLTDIDERTLASKVAPEFRTKITSIAFAPTIRRMGRKKTSALAFLAKKSARQKMVIYSQIFGPPVGLADDRAHH